LATARAQPTAHKRGRRRGSAGASHQRGGATRAVKPSTARMGVVPGQPDEAAEVRTTSAVASYQQGGAARAGDLRAYGKACPVCSRGINILQQVSPSSLPVCSASTAISCS